MAWEMSPAICWVNPRLGRDTYPVLLTAGFLLSWQRVVAPLPLAVCHAPLSADWHDGAR
ncbi:hypothetical protein FB106_106133 [Synechococcus sp. Ace-Pa]|nr:hypothetical protein FB106_106133 [Synechococcus sp. Ace-Pa]